MRKHIDLKGKKFNRLRVLKLHEIKKLGTYWLCKCDCGTEKIVFGINLRTGHTKSCGCFKKETTKKMGDSNVTHGFNGTRVHHIWLNMKYRCNTKTSMAYFRYGGRGIKVCARWDRFENFLKDMGQPPSDKHSIDRVDNNKGYSKSNCRWATSTQQMANIRTNKLLTFKGQTLHERAWARKLKINRSTLRGRLRAGWSVQRALTERPGAYRL